MLLNEQNGSSSPPSKMGHESPTPVPRKHHHGQSSDSCSSDGGGGPINIRPKKSRYPVEDDDDDGASYRDDRIECSGKYCRSCSGRLIADCVALCCCPCALVNLLTLALVKVPWMVGRRCLGLGKKKNDQGQNWNSKQKCNMKQSRSNSHRHQHQHQRCAVEEELAAEISCYALDFDQEGEEEVDDCVSSAERVWLELYQVGHLGFGRVSFSGVQCVALGKANLGT